MIHITDKTSFSTFIYKQNSNARYSEVTGHFLSGEEAARRGDCLRGETKLYHRFQLLISLNSNGAAPIRNEIVSFVSN